MSDFEDLRLIDLISKFRESLMQLNATRNLSILNTAGGRLQAVYDFFITSQKPYEEIQPNLKNLFSSFNYSAVIVNNAKKCGKLSGEDAELLNECIQVMLECCYAVEQALRK